MADRKKILVIDDDPDIVEAMRVILESRNYAVAIAKSGEEGLKMARQEKADLIILDLMMERSDTGFEVARQIRKEKNNASTPILILTAIKEKIGMDFKNDAGDKVWFPVDDYLEKPLKSAELIAKVEAILKGK